MIGLEASCGFLRASYRLPTGFLGASYGLPEGLPGGSPEGVPGEFLMASVVVLMGLLRWVRTLILTGFPEVFRASAPLLLPGFCSVGF